MLREHLSPIYTQWGQTGGLKLAMVEIVIPQKMTNAIKQPPPPTKRASLKTLASIPLETHTYRSVVFVCIFVLLHPLLCLTGNLIPIHFSLACMHLVETTRRHMREWLERYKSPLRDAQWWPWLLPRYTVAEGERTPEFSRIHAIALVANMRKQMSSELWGWWSEDTIGILKGLTERTFQWRLFAKQ